MSLLLSSAVRMLFPPATDQLLGANAPALWLKQAGGSAGNAQGIIRVVKGVAAMVAVVVVGAWMADHSALMMPPVVMLLLVLVIAYRLWKRG